MYRRSDEKDARHTGRSFENVDTPSQSSSFTINLNLDPHASPFVLSPPNSHSTCPSPKAVTSSASSSDLPLERRLSELAKAIRAPPPSPAIPELESLRQRIVIQAGYFLSHDERAHLERLRACLAAARRLRVYVSDQSDRLVEYLSMWAGIRAGEEEGDGEEEESKHGVIAAVQARRQHLDALASKLFERCDSLRQRIQEVENDVITRELEGK